MTFWEARVLALKENIEHDLELTDRILNSRLKDRMKRATGNEKCPPHVVVSVNKAHEALATVRDLLQTHVDEIKLQ